MVFQFSTNSSTYIEIYMNKKERLADNFEKLDKEMLLTYKNLVCNMYL